MAMAIMPGKMTSAGKSILGKAAMSGVRRAADMELADMARCTTRKSVHQYPKERTKPRPNTMANQSTPNGLSAAVAMCDQELVNVPGAKCWAVETTFIFST